MKEITYLALLLQIWKEILPDLAACELVISLIP